MQVQDETAEMRRLSEGVSVMATLQQARKRARQVPSLRGKRFVAELVIPDGSPIAWERTTKTPGHHTLWGDPDVMLGCVVSVSPVEAVH